MNEILNHEPFEELCALAALGQIPAEKFAELNDHIRACASCQATYASFSEILHAQFSQDEMQHTSKKVPNLSLRRDKHRKLFLSRAKKLGFRFSEDVEPRQTFWGKRSGFPLPSVSYRYALVLVTIASLLVTGVLGYKWQAQDTAKSAELTRLSNQNNNLRDENNSLRQQVVALRQGEVSLAIQLATARSNNSALGTRHDELEVEVREASLALQDLRTELEASRDFATARGNKLRKGEEALRVMTAELQSLRQARLEDASLAAYQQLQLDDLSRRLREQVEMLDRERRLMVADRDIRDLMGARNLHIYDVVDVDSKGKDKQSFGRVFYTEGKSLIFYAFDLDESNFVNVKHSFQAWGQRAGGGSAVSLGILYVDNAEQRRWALKFDDPEVLHHINSVFVTIEPFGGGKRPTGAKLLYAYLTNKPNHP